MIDVTPDAVPVISPVETLPGFIIATGFSGHGFGIGPAAGKLAADLVTNARSGGGPDGVPARPLLRRLEDRADRRDLGRRRGNHARSAVRAGHGVRPALERA